MVYHIVNPRCRAEKNNAISRSIKLWFVLSIALLTSACVGSQTNDALSDALDKPLRRCAGALAGDDMPTAREQCLPVVAIYQAVTGR